MSIREWPEMQRPRERLLSDGAAVLSDAELLAIFMRTGVRGRSAVDVSRDMLQDLGGLRSLLDAEQSVLCGFPGVGQTKFAHLQAALELGRRYLRETLDRSTVLTSATLTKDFVTAHLRHQPHEVFACLFLNSQHRLLQFEEMFKGTIDSASVHPREIVKRALALNAAAVILVHNHPSGNPEPSQQDEWITDHIRKALDLVDIRVLDHLIVGDGSVVSLAERGFF